MLFDALISGHQGSTVFSKELQIILAGLNSANTGLQILITLTPGQSKSSVDPFDRQNLARRSKDAEAHWRPHCRGY